MFQVYAYRSSNSKTQDGKGSAWHTLILEYSNKSDAAHRAKRLVEVEGYDCASVKEMKS